MVEKFRKSSIFKIFQGGFNYLSKQCFNYLLNSNLVKTGLLDPFLSKMIA